MGGAGFQVEQAEGAAPSPHSGTCPGDSDVVGGGLAGARGGLEKQRGSPGEAALCGVEQTEGRASVETRRSNEDKQDQGPLWWAWWRGGPRRTRWT